MQTSGRNLIETFMGGVVLILAAGFVFFAFKLSNISNMEGGYTVSAKFDRADGLASGSDVRVSGIKIGSVTNQAIDPETFLAVISMTIKGDIKLPKDSSAEIVSDGLLGGKYIAIVPGGEQENLKDQDLIQYTQSSVSIEQLIGKFMFSGGDKKKEEKPAPAAEPAE